LDLVVTTGVDNRRRREEMIMMSSQPPLAVINAIDDKLRADGSRYRFHDVWKQYEEFTDHIDGSVSFSEWLAASGWMDE
jgi:GH15 family glucan-1,4-alpha-glucosidase